MSVQLSADHLEFDQFADEYREALDRGVAASGESMEFFAEGRVKWLARCLTELSFSPARVLDFGCGTGTATQFLLRLPGVENVCGVDVSSRSLDVARRTHGSYGVEFQRCEDVAEEGGQDLVFTNGVFHHIPVGERARAVQYVARVLRPGGLFAFWENNPWNPGTRYVMSRIPFDRDAVTLSAREARTLLQHEGFSILRTDFLFICPRALRWLRWVEPSLCRLPFGAQYQVLARRRCTATGDCEQHLAHPSSFPFQLGSRTEVCGSCQSAHHSRTL
jgi:SAM-dependent methyltransferase